MELSSTSNPVEDMCATVSKFQSARIGDPWPTDKHVASWLGLCPENHIRVGTVRSTGSRRVPHRASRAWRMAAHSLRTSPSALGALPRRLRRTLGPAQATTATAHTLAKMLSPLLQETAPYRARSAEEYRHQDHARQLRQ